MFYVIKKENSKDKDDAPGEKKNKKRKSNTKNKSTPKKTRNKEWDSEKADETAEYEVRKTNTVIELVHAINLKQKICF